MFPIEIRNLFTHAPEDLVGCRRLWRRTDKPQHTRAVRQDFRGHLCSHCCDRRFTASHGPVQHKRRAVLVAEIRADLAHEGAAALECFYMLLAEGSVVLKLGIETKMDPCRANQMRYKKNVTAKVYFVLISEILRIEFYEV